MRIAVSTVPGSPEDLRIWSGTPAHFIQGLRTAAGDRAQIFPVRPLNPVLYFCLNKLAGVSGRLGRKINWEVEPLALRSFTRALDRQLRKARADAVIAMGWTPLGSKAGIPIVYWGDATVAQRIDLSPHWSNLSARTKAAIPRLESEWLSSFDATFWATNWAADDSKARYRTIGTHTVPFASNIADPGVEPKARDASKTISLLAVGVKWHRKGIDRAVLATDELVAGGRDAHLHVVGVQPPDKSWLRPHVTYHGFLSKSQEDERLKLHRLYLEADLFLLPTRNEPFGIVFQEAAAYALPAVTARVGGVPEVVDHLVTGITMAENSTPSEYANAIAELSDDDEAYRSMSSAARQRYEREFTWETCGTKVLGILDEITRVEKARSKSPTSS